MKVIMENIHKNLKIKANVMFKMKKKQNLIKTYENRWKIKKMIFELIFKSKKDYEGAK